MPKPDRAAPNPPAGPRFDDRWPMALGIPASGIAIPWLTGPYGPLSPARPMWWAGQALFIALAAALQATARRLALHAPPDLLLLDTAERPAGYAPRLPCRLGAVHHALPLEQLARLVSLDKITHAVALDGRRLVVDRPPAELEQLLDPARFFRATRQVIVAAQGVCHCASAGKGRVALTPAPDGEVLPVTQERAGAFRAWWEQAPAG